MNELEFSVANKSRNYRSGVYCLIQFAKGIAGWSKRNGSVAKIV